MMLDKLTAETPRMQSGQRFRIVASADSAQTILDERHNTEQYCGMKYLGVFLFALLLAWSVKTIAQDNPFSKGGQGSGSIIIPGQTQAQCPDYKIRIITPSKSVDFKMTVLTPPKNLDPGVVFKPCAEGVLAAQVIMPNQQLFTSDREMSDYLKGILLMSGGKR